MRQVRTLSFTLSPILLAAFAGTSAQAQVSPDRVWQVLGQMPKAIAQGEPWVRPTAFKPLALNAAALQQTLAQAPMEVNFGAPPRPLVMWLPMPDGTFARFNVWESPIMEPPLMAEFPVIRTYAGQGIDDPAATIRFDSTPQGFHSQILSPNGAVYIDPYTRGDSTFYSVYYKKDLARKADGWQCLVGPDEPLPRLVPPGGATDVPSGTTFRTYRLANAATGEYTAFHGGTVVAGQAAIVTAINRVSGVYEKDQSIRLILVANNSSIVYTNSATDPYTNTNPSSLLTQNQSTCDSIIGNANYDIGHVFSTGGGGLATLSCVGVTGQKARAETGLGSPIGDPFYIDYVAHEMGHQYGGNHSFNGPGGSCSGNRSASHAYEPGSGSTIMGYAGICLTDDLQAHSDDYFLWDNHNEITNYTSAGVRAGNTQTPTGNNIPTVNGGPDYNIPANTPFTLTAVGSDADPGQVLTYCWEERDLGAAQALSAADNGASPIFRSWNPTTSPSRTFPRLSNLLTNTLPVGEKYPAVARTLKFTVSVRDNRANGGGWNSDDVNVVVTNTGAAFAVTSPNTAVSWAGGSNQTVTWNVSGTAGSPINCTGVNILLSTDGGNTFPTTLLANTANDGSQSVTIPNTPSTQARIKVAGAGNIFFDLSNVNFTITAPTAPLNNNCGFATTIGNGTTAFTTVGATTDGPIETGCAFCCGDNQINQDVWYAYIATCNGTATASLCGASFNTKIAIYSGGCPGSPSAVACNDDSATCGAGSVQSVVTWPVEAGEQYMIRIGGFTTSTGTGNLVLSCAAAPTCYADCDHVGGLTANDFQCFLNAFVSAQTYANCDGVGGLTANDFQCFLNKFVAGCP